MPYQLGDTPTGTTMVVAEATFQMSPETKENRHFRQGLGVKTRCESRSSARFCWESTQRLFGVQGIGIGLAGDLLVQ